MERLTRLKKQNTGARGSATHTYGCYVHELVDKLAAYEDTGLSPEQINQMASDVIAGVEQYGNNKYAIIIAARELQAYQETGFTPERVAELAEAERDGRLHISPYKIGDTVFWTPNYTAYWDDIEEKIVTGYEYCIKIGSDISVRYSNPDSPVIFLTRAEAEAALKRRKSE